jgi:hypothetical protein
MARKSASLLTKTQRRRLQNDFEELDQAKKRRDQQRIRERLESGLLDFGLLADYPDEQLDLAVDDLSDDDLRAALADTYLVVERTRAVRGYDRADLLREARTRADDYATGPDTRTLSDLELRTEAEIRADTEEELRDQLGLSPWQRRSRGLLKFSGAMFLPVLMMLLSDGLFYTSFIQDGMTNTLSFILSVFGLFGLFGVLVVQLAHALKYNVVPGVIKLLSDPRGALADLWNVASSPGRLLRESWQKL